MSSGRTVEHSRRIPDPHADWDENHLIGAPQQRRGRSASQFLTAATALLNAVTAKHPSHLRV